ncbi:MAG TPA: MBL fold metallo-hydrolase [Candidatus Krumholzibacteria bacterium]|nr:MBL fold metallo-hydrolase [Candidatus Krumholzibacteria bacterium]
MRRSMAVLTVLCLLAFAAAAAAAAETVAGLPLHIHRFDSGAIRVWIGDHVSSTGVVAIPTAKGIVVIDTTGDPAVDRELRRIIARELGRDDFVMLINTHDHGDHTGGNEVYADCEIVGHALVAEAMARQVAERPHSIEWGTRRVAELEPQVAALAADAPDGPRLREELAVARLHLAAAQATMHSTPPTRTFTDRLDLDFGDTKFELFYIGGMHSASDIAVLVPKHRLLMTGDTMADVWLTETPGCLASFTARSGIAHDFPMLLRNWNLLLARQADVGTLVTGHWNGELTWPGFERRVQYIATLWDGVQRAAEAGTPLATVQADYALATRFPDLVDSRGCDPRFNAGTIREMWSVVTGQSNASDALMAVMEDEARFAAVIAQVRAQSPDYYHDERSLNGIAYWMLQNGRAAQAVDVFRLNVELYPGSWNTYDSLAEGLLQIGDREGAQANYARSLELNPQNENGTRMLEQIRDGVDAPAPVRPGQL